MCSGCTGNRKREAFLELFKIRRHRIVLVGLALLAMVPLPIVLAGARPAALLALAPYPLVLADARPTALLAPAPSPVVLTFYLRSLLALPHPAAPSLASVWHRPLPAALSTRSLTTALSLPLIRCPAAA